MSLILFLWIKVNCLYCSCLTSWYDVYECEVNGKLNINRRLTKYVIELHKKGHHFDPEMLDNLS